VSSAGTSLIEPPPHEWVAVVAFYAAVHYLNGYLFEVRGYVPPNHDSRALLVRGDPVLRQCHPEYQQLWDHGFRARYWRSYRLPEADARALTEVNLVHIASVVMAAVGG